MESPLISPDTYITATFATLLQPFNPSSSAIQKWTNLLLSTYSEPHRYYHTATHIYSMLQHFSSCLPQMANSTAVGLAIIFHDWEHIPHSPSGWNEEQSKVHFDVFAEELRLPAPLISTVKQYITATISHKVPPGDEHDGDLKLFLDFDLEVLGRERKEYETYMRQIRREYSQFADDQYVCVRKAALKKFLDTTRLFFSDVFFEGCEERARGNLQWEVEMLEGDGRWGPMAELMSDVI
jgi:predicted metal-dependent HD superfamily phosphohydrolase